MKKPPPIHSDLGTLDRCKHGPIVLEAVPEDMATTTNRDRVRALEIDDPLYVYRRKRVISVAQRAGGMALRGLWVKCGLQPSVISRYEDMISAGGVKLVYPSSIDHYQRFVEAVRQVGPIASNEVMSVVCLQEFIRRGQYEILRRGLQILAKEFGC